MADNTILILNGPGLSDLSVGGTRYGDLTLDLIRDECSARCEQLGLALDFRQSDDQDEIFRWIAEDSGKFAGLIINPVGYFKSNAVDFDRYRSAILEVAHLKKPVVEVHMTNIFTAGDKYARPLQAPEAELGFVCGLGLQSYLFAVNAIATKLQS